MRAGIEGEQLRNAAYPGQERGSWPVLADFCQRDEAIPSIYEADDSQTEYGKPTNHSPANAALGKLGTMFRDLVRGLFSASADLYGVTASALNQLLNQPPTTACQRSRRL